MINYNLYSSDQFKINDLVKISIHYDNAFDNQLDKYVGPLTEHIWTKILEIKVNQELTVIISNNCFFSESKSIKAYQFEDIIKINCQNIKEAKRYNHKSYNDQINKLTQIISLLPDNIKQELVNKSESEAVKYLEKYLFTVVN